jgi:hypothetical protein
MHHQLWLNCAQGVHENKKPASLLPAAANKIVVFNFRGHDSNGHVLLVFPEHVIEDQMLPERTGKRSGPTAAQGIKPSLQFTERVLAVSSRPPHHGCALVCARPKKQIETQAATKPVWKCSDVQHDIL